MAAASRTQKASDFENLVRNGIEFLEKAMSQLDSDPKHSVINFHTAVELFLKAPLVHEHWSLVVVDRDPNRQKYEGGDFLSVSFDDACTRLSSSLSRPLHKGAKEVFDKVRRHRNRMVHFYHSGIDGKQRNEIKLEQAQAWFELNRFIADTWREEFKAFQDDFRRMERTLIANNHYASAKFASLANKIQGLKKQGKEFECCPRCGTDACLIEEEADRLILGECMVCFHCERRVRIDCPECGAEGQHVTAYDGFSCEECEHVISDQDALFELLDQSQVRGTKDSLDADTPANCDECQCYHSVCDYDGGYVCVNCLTPFHELTACAWCNEFMTQEREDSYLTGCEHCEGLAGHHAGD